MDDLLIVLGVFAAASAPIQIAGVFFSPQKKRNGFLFTNIVIYATIAFLTYVSSQFILFVSILLLSNFITVISSMRLAYPDLTVFPSNIVGNLLGNLIEVFRYSENASIYWELVKDDKTQVLKIDFYYWETDKDLDSRWCGLGLQTPRSRKTWKGKDNPNALGLQFAAKGERGEEEFGLTLKDASDIEIRITPEILHKKARLKGAGNIGFNVSTQWQTVTIPLASAIGTYGAVDCRSIRLISIYHEHRGSASEYKQSISFKGFKLVPMASV